MNKPKHELSSSEIISKYGLISTYVASSILQILKNDNRIVVKYPDGTIGSTYKEGAVIIAALDEGEEVPTLENLLDGMILAQSRYLSDRRKEEDAIYRTPMGSIPPMYTKSLYTV